MRSNKQYCDKRRTRKGISKLRGKCDQVKTNWLLKAHFIFKEKTDGAAKRVDCLLVTNNTKDSYPGTLKFLSGYKTKYVLLNHVTKSSYHQNVKGLVIYLNAVAVASRYRSSRSTINYIYFYFLSLKGEKNVFC